MKNSASLLLLFTIIAFGLSCAKDDDGDDVNVDPPAATPANFLENLQTGDQMHFALWTVQTFLSANPGLFQYTGDTLELEVLEISPSGLLISEKITPGSNMMSSTTTYYWNKDTVYLRHWNIVDDSLFITHDLPHNSSHLIKIPRLKFSDYSEPEVTFIGWRTPTFNLGQQRQFFTANFTLFDHVYDTLSVYIDNRAMAIDDHGKTHVFSQSDGIVRTSRYNGESGWAQGWDRIR